MQEGNGQAPDYAALARDASKKAAQRDRDRERYEQSAKEAAEALDRFKKAVNG